MTESCYWCAYFNLEYDKHTQIRGFCRKHLKQVWIEDDACVEFDLYKSLSSLLRTGKT